MTSTVVYYMVSRGAAHWIRASLVDISRLTKGSGRVGLSPEQYDHGMMAKTLDYLQQGGQPDLLTDYFMGLDNTSARPRSPTTWPRLLTRRSDGWSKL